MLPIAFVILVSFTVGIRAQTAPTELREIVPPDFSDEVDAAYNSLPSEQQGQATAAAQSLSPEQRSQARTLFSDPNVQNGNVDAASPTARDAGRSLCGSTSPDQQSFIFGLANAVGINAPATSCDTLGSDTGGTPSPTPAPTPGPTPAPGTPGTTAAPGVPATPGPATPSPGGAPAPAPAGNGSDIHPRCCIWARMGECDRNPFWMKPNCPNACGTPGATVENALSMPSNPSTNCTTGGMGPTGPMPGSPGTGMPGMGPSDPNCPDMHPNCQRWAAMGECRRNPFWMRPNCQQSCRTCGATVGTALQFGGRGG